MFVSVLSWSWQYVYLAIELTMCLYLSCHGVSNMFILSWSWPYMIMPFLSRRLQYVNACLAVECIGLSGHIIGRMFRQYVSACLVVEFAVCIGLSCHGIGGMFRPVLSWSCQ